MKQRSPEPNHQAFIIFTITNFDAVLNAMDRSQGENLIHMLRQIIEQLIRDQDAVGHFGINDYLLVCSNTGESGAKALSERLMKSVAALPLPKGLSLQSECRITAQFKSVDLDALLS